MSNKTIFKRSKKFNTIEEFVRQNNFTFNHCYISYNYQDVLNDVEKNKKNGIIDDSKTVEYLNAGNIYIAIA